MAILAGGAACASLSPSDEVAHIGLGVSYLQSSICGSIPSIPASQSPGGLAPVGEESTRTIPILLAERPQFFPAFLASGFWRLAPQQMDMTRSSRWRGLASPMLLLTLCWLDSIRTMRAVWASLGWPAFAYAFTVNRPLSSPLALSFSLTWPLHFFLC